MKKTLFMCALGLTVATSMVAGTMAIYTHTDEFAGEVTEARAKHFYVGADTSNSTDVSLVLAPGQSADWEFSLTNVDINNITSETNTDVKISIDSQKINNWADFTIQLVEGDTVVETGVLNSTTKQIELTSVKFLANTAFNKDYKLRFIWNDDASKGATLDDAADTALVYNKKDDAADYPDAAGVKVTITGTQSADDTPFIR